MSTNPPRLALDATDLAALQGELVAQACELQRVRDLVDAIPNRYARVDTQLQLRDTLRRIRSICEIYLPLAEANVEKMQP